MSQHSKEQVLCDLFSGTTSQWRNTAADGNLCVIELNWFSFLFFLNFCFIASPNWCMETHCVFSCCSHFVDDKLQTGETKSSHQMWWLYAATKVPPPSLAFMTPVKPSAAICGHYPGDQTETQTDSTCSEAVRQGLLKDAPLKPLYQTDSAMIRRPACKQTRKSNQGILFLLHSFRWQDSGCNTLTGQLLR